MLKEEVYTLPGHALDSDIDGKKKGWHSWQTQSLSDQPHHRGNHNQEIHKEEAKNTYTDKNLNPKTFYDPNCR